MNNKIYKMYRSENELFTTQRNFGVDKKRLNNKHTLYLYVCLLNIFIYMQYRVVYPVRNEYVCITRAKNRRRKNQFL